MLTILAAGTAAVAMMGASAAAVAATDVTPPAPFDLIADAGDYQIGFEIASPWNSVSASWHLTSDGTTANPDIAYEMAVDGVVERVVQSTDDSSGTLSKRVDVPEGAHTLSITAVDEAGNRRTASQELTVFVDKYDPTFGGPVSFLMRPGKVATDAVPMRYRWSAEDIGTGLARVLVGYGVTCCFEVDPTASSADFAIPMFSERTWRVTISDGVGRTDRCGRQAWIEAVPDRQLGFKGRWDSRATSVGLNDAEYTSRNKGDRVAFYVKGRAFSWVATQGPNRGVAEIYVDGRLETTVNLRAPEVLSARAVAVVQVGQASRHRVVIVNKSPRQRTAISVDSILIQGNR